MENDWTFGQGTGTYLIQQRAIAVDIKTAVLFFLNDFFAAMSTGIDWWNLLGSQNPAAKANILLQTRAAIISREGVVQINSATITVDPSTRRARVFFNIDTIYSRNVTGSVQTP